MIRAISKTWIALWVALVIASAFAVVVVRHQNRIAFNTLEKLAQARDVLSIEWRQLMAEKATWNVENNVEAEARDKAAMRVPGDQEMQLVELGARGMRRTR